MVFEKDAVKNSQDEIVEEGQIVGNGTKKGKKFAKIVKLCLYFLNPTT